MSRPFFFYTLTFCHLLFLGCTSATDPHAGHDHGPKKVSSCDHDHDHTGHDHGPKKAASCDHDHDHTGHDHGPVSGNSVEISSEGQRNIALETTIASASDPVRFVHVPGRVIGKPGHWQMAVAAPIGGVVEAVHITTGQSVEPGHKLFEIRITQEDAIDRQTKLLELLEQREVIAKEIARLEEIVSSGAVAGKTLLERQYEQQKLDAAIRANVEGLELLGFQREQVDSILHARKLVRHFTVPAPSHHECDDCEESHILSVANLNVIQGQQVATGESLAMLGDYCRLQIEGFASETDMPALRRALRDSLPLSVLIGSEETRPLESKSGFKILYIDSEANRESRSFRFILDLANEIIHDTTDETGKRRFATWKHRPGEWVELLLPIGSWKNRVVLPADAVIQDGAESIVFLKEGDLFIRKPVATEFRDVRRVILKPDSLREGETVVTTGAFRVHLALKNASGAVIDEHAGHSH